MDRDLLGVPWQWRGRTVFGADCYGWVCLYYQQVLDLELPDLLGAYQAREDAMHAVALHIEDPHWLVADEAQIHDVAVFGGGHLGVVTGLNPTIVCMMVEAVGIRRVTIGGLDVLDRFWTPRHTGYRRHVTQVSW